MAFTGRKSLSFVSKAYPDEGEERKFEVESFEGTERISSPYQFTITLISRDPAVDLKKMMQEPATFTIEGGETPRFFHGILEEFHQMRQVKENVFYQAVLVPRLWQAELHEANQNFIDKNVPDIIEEVLEQSGLTGTDYELKLKEEYPVWEYICQYRESNLNFLSRWMEREGIYYFFEQGDEQEKVIITDSNMAHVDHPGGAKLTYTDPSGMVPADKDLVTKWECRQNLVPQKVLLKDYNYRKPSLEVRAEEEVDSNGRGNVYVYEEHFKDPDEGQKLAKVRGEYHKSRQTMFVGEGTAEHLTPGYHYDLEGHYRFSEDDKNKYLVTEVKHFGSQTGKMSGGREGKTKAGKTKLGYSNEFTAIAKANDAGDIQYRPRQKAKRTKFYGMMNATVDAAGDGQYAELDDQGRYKVILPYDLSGRKDGKASRFVRMVQAYSGPGFGMHFPLHKGAEVLLTFIDGDLDRPVISGTVPNPENKSPVTDANQSQSAVRTFGGNDIILEDTDGSQQVHIKQTCGNEVLLDAAEPKIEIKQECGNQVHLHGAGPDIEIIQECGNEVFMKAGGPDIEIKQACGNIIEMHEASGITMRDKYGNEVVLDAAAGFIRIASPSHDSFIELGKSIKSETKSEKKLFVGGASAEVYIGNKNEMFGGVKTSVFKGLEMGTRMGMKVEYCKAKDITKTSGQMLKECQEPINMFSNKEVEITGANGVVFLDDKKALIHTSDGGPKVEIEKSGKITIETTKGDVVVKASGKVNVTGKEVTIDGGPKVELKGSEIKGNGQKVLLG